MALKYYMRAYKTTNPVGFVYWTVNDAPDSTGAQSGYSTGSLTSIIVNKVEQAITSLSGVQYAALIENPLGTGSFQVITADMIQAAFTVSLSGGTNLEVGQSISPSFTVSYTGGTPVSAVLSNNFDGYTVTGSSPFTTLNTSSYSPNNVYTKNAYGQSVVFIVTANNGSTNKTGTATINWFQKVFFGVGATGQSSEAFVEALANSPITSTRSRTFTVSPSNQKIYYAHRTAYGLLAPTDFVVGGFAGGFINTATVSITNTYGFTENYYVYESDNLLTGSTTVTVS